MKIVFKYLDSGMKRQSILISGEKHPDTIPFLIVTFAVSLFYREKEEKVNGIDIFFKRTYNIIM